MISNARGPDGKMAKWRSVTTVKDDNHFTFEMFLTGSDGEENKMMTMEYTRKATK
jgi:hypothetical protein